MEIIMKYHELTWKEYAILHKLRIAGHQSSKSLRQTIHDQLGAISDPGFYKILDRLEGKALVTRRAKKSRTNGYVVTENWFRITPKGIEVAMDALEFFAVNAGLDIFNATTSPQ